MGGHWSLWFLEVSPWSILIDCGTGDDWSILDSSCGSVSVCEGIHSMDGKEVLAPDQLHTDRKQTNMKPTPGLRHELICSILFFGWIAFHMNYYGFWMKYQISTAQCGFICFMKSCSTELGRCSYAKVALPRYDFKYDFVTYKWPSWLNPQSKGPHSVMKWTLRARVCYLS